MREYERLLAEAQIITPTTYTAGLPVWRERGLVAARLLIDRYTQEVSEHLGKPLLVEHPFTLPAAPYRAIFEEYQNIYRAEVPDIGQAVLRPDNMHANVDLLRRTAGPGPVIATGGLLRSMRRGASPLFRDRYMWPAVQLNQLVPPSDSRSVLDVHQSVLERTFRAAGLPVVSVQTDALSSYGRTCYLTVSCLPDGRPTVLSTSYIMSDRYRSALGGSDDVIDIGFTGKVIALIALHHWDSHGLQLPTSLAPTQVGVITDGEIPSIDAAYQQSGLRVSILRTRQRQRAERRLFRIGVPVLVGLHRDGGVRLTSRAPLKREQYRTAPAPHLLRDELAAYDDRLLSRAQRRFDRGLRDTALLRGMCRSCATSAPVFGWTIPDRLRECGDCGLPGREALVAPSGRFY
ncbi:hypothetical protein [Nocardia sp. NPDC059691]|uniref:hypothetical protein n=1 Tax=Nocardia sp. NPDC059691 TaxID=3346908 RepID=UPI0036CEC5E0